MIEIECLVCGKIIEIPEFIDANNYDGQVACRECAALLRVKLVGDKVRQYEVIAKEFSRLTAEDNITAAPEPKEPAKEEEAAITNITKYNPLRDYLASYRASQLQLAFEQIEHIIGCQLEAGASTFKSWWENESQHPQAFAWLEAGWQVSEVNLPQQVVTFKREPERG